MIISVDKCNTQKYQIMRLLFVFIVLSISNSIFAVDPIINPATSQPANGSTNGACFNFPAMEFDNTKVKQEPLKRM